MSDANLVVDLDALDRSVVLEEVTIDPNADPFATPPPPPDGTHRFKLKLGKDWKKDVTKPKNGAVGTEYLANRIQCQCVAEGEKYHNMNAFDNVNTLVFDGKCRMAGILKSAGVAVPERITYVDLAILFRQTLTNEPIVKIRGRWKAQEKYKDNGADAYSTVLTGMRNFPPRKGADGSVLPGEYNHVVKGPKSGDDCGAQFEILEYLPD